MAVAAGVRALPGVLVTPGLRRVRSAGGGKVSMAGPAARTARPLPAPARPASQEAAAPEMHYPDGYTAPKGGE